MIKRGLLFIILLILPSVNALDVNIDNDILTINGRFNSIISIFNEESSELIDVIDFRNQCLNLCDGSYSYDLSNINLILDKSYYFNVYDYSDKRTKKYNFGFREGNIGLGKGLFEKCISSEDCASGNCAGPGPNSDSNLICCSLDRECSFNNKCYDVGEFTPDKKYVCSSVNEFQTCEDYCSSIGKRCVNGECEFPPATCFDSNQIPKPDNECVDGGFLDSNKNPIVSTITTTCENACGNGLYKHFDYGVTYTKGMNAVCYNAINSGGSCTTYDGRGNPLLGTCDSQGRCDTTVWRDEPIYFHEVKDDNNIKGLELPFFPRNVEMNLYFRPSQLNVLRSFNENIYAQIGRLFPEEQFLQISMNYMFSAGMTFKLSPQVGILNTDKGLIKVYVPRVNLDRKGKDFLLSKRGFLYEYETSLYDIESDHVYPLEKESYLNSLNIEHLVSINILKPNVFLGSEIPKQPLIIGTSQPVSFEIISRTELSTSTRVEIIDESNVVRKSFPPIVKSYEVKNNLNFYSFDSIIDTSDLEESIYQLRVYIEDINGNSNQEIIAQFELLQESSSCKELIEGHNNLEENRFNLVFLGIGYDNLEIAKDYFLGSVDFEGTQKGIFSLEPFKSNKDKFNIWYVSRIGEIPTDECASNILWCALGAMQDLQSYCVFNNKVVSALINDDFRSSTSFRLSSTTSFLSNSDIRVVVHEFGHLYGVLLDEYIGWGGVETQPIEERNCYSEGITYDVDCDIHLCDVGNQCTYGCPIFDIDCLKELTCRAGDGCVPGCDSPDPDCSASSSGACGQDGLCNVNCSPTDPDCFITCEEGDGCVVGCDPVDIDCGGTSERPATCEVGDGCAGGSCFQLTTRDVCIGNTQWKDLIGKGCYGSESEDCIGLYNPPLLLTNGYESETLECKDDSFNCYTQVGCFESCHYKQFSIFRPTYNSIMRYHDFDPYSFGLVNERIICNQIKADTESAGGYCTEKFGIS